MKRRGRRSHKRHGKKHRHWGHVRGHSRRVNPGGYHSRRSRRFSGLRRFRNPSTQEFMSVGKAVAVGIVAGLAASFGITKFLPASSATVKNLVLVGAAALAAMYLSPILAAGAATGLLLIPGVQLAGTAFGKLGLVPTTAAAPAATAGLGTLLAPHMGTLMGRGYGTLQAPQMSWGVTTSGGGSQRASYQALRDHEDDKLLRRMGIT